MLESAKQICPKMQAIRLIATERFELAYETVIATGAVSVTKPVTLITTVPAGAAIALSLPNGYEGQKKTILMTAHAGSTYHATVTPTSAAFSTILFDTALDSWEGIFVLGKWHTLGTATATVS